MEEDEDFEIVDEMLRYDEKKYVDNVSKEVGRRGNDQGEELD